MLDPAQAQERCAAAIDLALKAGADAADAVAIGSSSEQVQVRLGKLEDVSRSESEDLGLRVFVGQRSASIHATDVSDAALRELAERAVAMAKAAPEDEYAGLAPEELLAKGPHPDLDLVDPAEPSPQALRALGEEAEDAARAVPGVTNSEGAGANFGRSAMALVTSHGFSGSYSSTGCNIGASVVAGEGSRMQRDYEHRATRFGEDMPSPGEIGRIAGERAVARLDPGRMASKAMSGPAIARRASFLLDKLDDELFAPGLRVIEEPHRKRGLRSRPFDGEGLPSVPRALVEDGRLTGWLTNAASARQLGVGLTGHAARGASGAPGVGPSNIYIAPGEVTRDELIVDITEGVLVTELIGQGVNGVTGDYSRGASGFRIENGKIAGPIAEFTIAGNLIDMFRQMRAADDLDIHRATDVPTLRIDGMTIAGD
jgi:PmbA protein